MTTLYPCSRWNYKFSQFVRVALLTVLYWCITFLLMMALEPSIYPPGFTGNGSLALLVIGIGAMHLARHLKHGWFFLLFGGIPALLYIPSYLQPDWVIGQSIAKGGEATLLGYVIRCIIFTISVALITRWIALARWRIIDKKSHRNNEVPSTSPPIDSPQ